MVDIRTVTLPALWADDAITEIPTPPIANTTYRNTDLGSTELLAGWPFQKIVDSADFNQTLWLISNLVKSCEQYGIMPWCASTTYKQNGICLASNGIFYWAKKENTGVNPVNDSGMTNWGIFLDPGDNFVTETVLTSQINLCEKLANKTQTLSSSSTTTQYPSAKCVYDNITNAKADLQAQITSNDSDITNLQNNKQNNITGGASSITSSNLTANRALVSNGSGKVAVANVTSTELGYLDGVTSNIQNQLNGKQASGSYMTLSDNQTASGNKTFSGQLIRSTAPSASDNSTQVPNTFWVNSRITSIMNSQSGVEQPNYATFQGLITSSSGNKQSTTAPSKGWIFARMQLDNNTTRTVSVNGNEIINVRSGADYLNGNECGACFPVNSGDTISCVRATIYFCSNY